MTRSLTGIAWNKEKYQGTPLQLDDDRLGEGYMKSQMRKMRNQSLYYNFRRVCGVAEEA